MTAVALPAKFLTGGVHATSSSGIAEACLREAAEGRQSLLETLPDLIAWAEEVGGCRDYVAVLHALLRAREAQHDAVLNAFVTGGTFPALTYGLRPDSSEHVSPDSLLGPLGFVALNKSIPTVVVRAYAGLRHLFGPEPTPMNGETAAAFCGMSRHRLLDRKGRVKDGENLLAAGLPSVADQLGALGFTRIAGDHLDFFVNESGNVVARADEWTYDEAATLPLCALGIISTIQTEGRVGLTKVHTADGYDDSDADSEGQICGLLSEEQLELVTDPTKEAWNQSDDRPGSTSRDVADDAAFRLWLILLAFFADTRLVLTTKVVMLALGCKPDTAGRTLRHLARLGLLTAIEGRSLAYHWDLAKYLLSGDHADALGGPSARGADWPWRNRSGGLAIPRNGSQHVTDFHNGTYLSKRLERMIRENGGQALAPPLVQPAVPHQPVSASPEMLERLSEMSWRVSGQHRVLDVPLTLASDMEAEDVRSAGASPGE